MTNTDMLERYHEWRELRDAGFSFAAIAERYGVTKQAVHTRLRKGPPQMGGHPVTVNMVETPCDHPGQKVRGMCPNCYSRAYRRATR